MIMKVNDDDDRFEFVDAPPVLPRATKSSQSVRYAVHSAHPDDQNDRIRRSAFRQPDRKLNLKFLREDS